MGVAIKLETQLLRSAELPTVCTSWRTTTERNAHSWDADTSAVKAGLSVKSAKNVGLTLVALSAFNIEELPRRPIVFPGMETTLPSAPKLVATPDDLTVNSTADLHQQPQSRDRQQARMQQTGILFVDALNSLESTGISFPRLCLARLRSRSASPIKAARRFPQHAI